MATTLSLLLPLADLSVGASARIADIRGGCGLIHKLYGLGLRVGSRVAILHRRGAGVVLANAENRVAIGGGIAESLWVEPLGGHPPVEGGFGDGGL